MLRSAERVCHERSNAERMVTNSEGVASGGVTSKYRA